MIAADDSKLTRTLLYLDGVAVSFDGYKALRGLSLILERAKCARSSAPTAPARRP